MCIIVETEVNKKESKYGSIKGATRNKGRKKTKRQKAENIRKSEKMT